MNIMVLQNLRKLFSKNLKKTNTKKTNLQTKLLPDVRKIFLKKSLLKASILEHQKSWVIFLEKIMINIHNIFF